MASARSLARPRTAPRPTLGLHPVPPSLARHAERFRGPFLDALPIAGAIIALEDDRLELIGANADFEALGGESFIRRCGFAEQLIAFLRGDEGVLTLDWVDGDAITGRSYSVRVARVALIEGIGPRCLITLLDRTAERATEKSLRLEMFNDALTGLPNRAGFSEQLDRALAEAEPGGIAVLLIDLTRFSRVNESMGALAGDELLITVARRLLSALRAGDLLARTGGDEFGIFLRVKDGAPEALAAAQRVSSVFAGPCRLSDVEIRVGCAIGCAIHEPGCDADELIRRAQFALKEAKRTGDTQVYQPRAHDLACHQFTIETSLRRAIEAERLSLAFQPVIELATGRVAGFEALARWQEDGAAVPPSTFIPVAEESGLIVPLGRWALAAALRTMAEWDRLAGRPSARVAVNVSAIQIARDDLPTLMSEVLAETGVKPDRLTLELTESAIVAEPERAARTMHEVREIGATLALDDFGTGYSNLAYLQRLPIDVLKIDQSFVTGMLGDRDKVAIVRAILSLADALGLKTTAEGVETEQLAQTLAALGCTRAQGYFYARPLDAQAAYDFWSRSNSAAT
jgi:diguanylate cyclase (GGDEF)-like protein